MGLNESAEECYYRARAFFYTIQPCPAIAGFQVFREDIVAKLNQRLL